MTKSKILMAISPILLSAALAHAQGAAPPMPANGGDLNRDVIIAAERAAMDALKSGNLAAFAATITDDAIFVNSSGIAHKSDVLKDLVDFQLKDYTMSDLRFVPVSAENGVISYVLTESGTSHGKPFSARFFVSSGWVRAGRGFQCVFNQETPAG